MNSEQNNHYTVLGLHVNASAEEIRAAYKILVLQYHPDKASEEDKITYTKKFQEISSAYEILSDPEKKIKYDQMLSAPQVRDFDDIIVTHPRNREPRAPQMRFQKSPDITISIAIGLADAYKGVTREIRFTRKVIVDPRGEKMHDMSCYAICQLCGGRGGIQIFAIASIPITRPCLRCNTRGCVLKPGYNLVEVESCHELCCHGGIKDMDMVRLENFGNWELGFFPGDVILRVRVFGSAIVGGSTPLTYTRQNNDLYIQSFPILLSQALCGGDFRIVTLDNRSLFITFAGPIRNGEEKVIEGEGMPILVNGHPSGKGNLIIRFDVQFPTLSDAKKAALLTILPIADQITKGGHEITKILK